MTSCYQGTRQSPMMERFKQKGEVENEVTLRFEDSTELYVATDILKLASPVFKTMLESNFKEKKTGVIEMKGKNLDDVLEMLNYFHPAVQTRITDSTVFRIIPLAEEYVMANLIKDCKRILRAILKNEQPKLHFTRNYSTKKDIIETSHCDSLDLCIKILHVANKYSYYDIKGLAMDMISQFPSLMYFNDELPTLLVPIATCTTTEVSPRKRCAAHFSTLQDDLRLIILKKRLKHSDVEHSFDKSLS